MTIAAGAVLSPGVAARLPARLGDVLVGLGTLANELAIAVADARLRERQAELALARVSQREDHPFLPPEIYMVGDWVTAARDHAERLIAIYTHIAAAYAAHTLDAFTRVARGDQLQDWQAVTIVPSDILTMPDVFLPLVQLPDDAGAESSRQHIPHFNENLRQSHTEASRAVARHARREAVTILDQPDRLADRQPANDLDDELPTTVHAYAATAILMFEILISGRRDPRQ